MPRVARKNSKSYFYHIVVKGISKEYIFEKEEYMKEYKKIISKKLETSNINILAYCIMNNHAHFLIYSPNCRDLGKYMQRVNTTYSNFYNRTNKREGYVFKDRYHSQEILNQKHLYSCLRYIHNNPVKAKIVRTMNEYKYSSYNEFLGKKYIINDKSINILFDKNNNFNEQFNFIHRKLDNEEDFIDIKDKTIEEFIVEVESQYNIKIGKIKRDKDILKRVIKEARKETGVTLNELSKLLGIAKSTVSNYDNNRKDGKENRPLFQER